MDRLPPVLRFEFYEDITSRGLIKDFRPFDDMTITYTTTDGQEKEIRYMCKGTIFLVNGNHFIAWWKVSRNEFMEYDGMKNGGKAQNSGVSFSGGSARKGAVLVATFFVVTR